jgi:peroxiredoxin
MGKFLAIPVLICAALSAAAPVRFELRDTNGAVHTAEEWRAKKAVVLFFTMTDCPLANGYVPEMNRLLASYSPQGVAFYAVQVDSTVTDAAVKKYTQEFAYTFPMLNDPHLILARLTGAKVTPEVAVLAGKAPKEARTRAVGCSINLESK